MTAALMPTIGLARDRGLRLSIGLLMLSLTLVVTGCSKKEKVATQAAARVNDQEITVHQINQVLEQQRAMPPEMAASASRQVLARLIDQELAVQEALNQKLDRDPRVVRQIEASRREIIARAYLERVGAGVPRPTAEEVAKYFVSNPALFSERRIYSLDELDIEAKPDQRNAIRSALEGAKDVASFTGFLKANGYRYNLKQSQVPAEQLPLDRLGPFSKMKDGQSTFSNIPNGVQVLVLTGSRLQPVTEEQARPLIEQFLLNERRFRVRKDDMAALRAAAKIEYLGEFANGAKPAAADPAASATSPLVPSTPASAVVENALKSLK